MSSHTCIKTLCISFRRYVHTSTAQACPFKNHESDHSWSSCSSSTSSILLQLELSYLLDAAEDQNIAKAPSYRVLLSSLSFCPSPKILSSPQNYCSPPLSDLYPFSICSLLYSAKPPFLQQSSDLLLSTSVASSRSFSKSLNVVPIRFPGPPSH